ncbi:MAG: pentapeptide repeat-containing protein [Phycisphaerae bacterium]|nr:pentapeptide repeat-containing protein [Phycisphaerae bacterium]
MNHETNTARMLDVLRGLGNVAERQAEVDAICSSGTVLPISDMSLHGCDLSGLHLTRVPMHRIDLRDVTAHGTAFSSMFGCAMDRIDASGAHFTRLERCSLRGARLLEARLGARMSTCDFAMSDLRRATILSNTHNIQPYYYANVFSGANLCELDAAGSYLAKTRFDSAILTNARLSRADLSGCILDDARLDGANLIRADLRGTMLRQTIFDRAIVTKDQKAAIVVACSPHMTCPQVVSLGSSLCMRDLVHKIDLLSEFRIVWEYQHSRLPRREKLVLWKDAAGPPASGIGAFTSDTRECIRAYPVNNAQPLINALQDIAADYADWTLDEKSLHVEEGALLADHIASDLFRSILLAMSADVR